MYLQYIMLHSTTLDDSTLVQVHDMTQGTGLQEKFMIHVTSNTAQDSSDSSLHSQYILVVSYATLSNRSTTCKSENGKSTSFII